MKKIVYPIFEKCPIHSSAIKSAKGQTELEVDLKNAFHYGYIISYGHQLRPGVNPLFTLFENSIDDGRELRFVPPGIAADADTRTSSSSMLGRSLTLGILSQFYNYTWFASVSNLRKTPLNGWSAESKNPGNSPDFLVANNLDFAVAEAKGTQKHIRLSSTKTTEWRTQVNNIIIKKDGKPVSFKSWIIATRFVLSTQLRAKPEMLIEDPQIQGRELSANDTPSLSLWIATDHIIRNLERLQLYNIIIRIREPYLPKTYALVWQCSHPKLDHLRFVGRSLDFDPNLIIPYWDEDYFPHKEDRIRFLNRMLHPVNGGFFDGFELNAVRDIIDGQVPRQLEYDPEINGFYDFINLLSDGSIIAPMSLMRLIDIKEL
jgi:hypothetical protein